MYEDKPEEGGRRLVWLVGWLVGWGCVDRKGGGIWRVEWGERKGGREVGGGET